MPDKTNESNYIRILVPQFPSGGCSGSSHASTCTYNPSADADLAQWRASNSAQSCATIPRQSNAHRNAQPKVVTYFIQPVVGGLVKIGKAADAASRLMSLQCGSPVRLLLLGYVVGDHEQDLHLAFQHLRQRGEWFRPESDLVCFVREHISGGIKQKSNRNSKVGMSDMGRKSLIRVGRLIRNASQRIDEFIERLGECDIDELEAFTADRRNRTNSEEYRVFRAVLAERQRRKSSALPPLPLPLPAGMGGDR